VKNTILILVGVFVVLAGVGNSIHKKRKKAAQQTEVRIETVAPGEFVEIINAPGEISPQSKVDISAKVSARIVELPVKEGDRVTAGNADTDPSLLIRLDSKDLQSQLLSAVANRDAQAARIEVEKANVLSQKASLKGTLAQVQKMERDFERQKKLLESHDISQSAFDEIQCSLQQMRSQYESARHGIDAAELNLTVMAHNLKAADAHIEEVRDALNYTTIYAPIDGVVTQINAEVGEVVITGTMNNPGTVIMQVADLSTMLLLAEVDETNIGQVHIGQKAKIHVPAFWEEEFDGVVQNIALTHRLSRSGAKYYKTEILITGDVEKLYSGLDADVDIETHRYDEVIKVPSQAVLSRRVDSIPLDIADNNPIVDPRKTEMPVVYRYIDGKAVVTPVVIGPSDLTHTLIAAGLSEGDAVIIGPYKILETLTHDMTVTKEKFETPDTDDTKPSPEEK